ncbi:MAG TPA: hypothetical protein DCP71_12760 [Verrucomicrobiales bacterium]|jgi:hypothetical protein|nr:hypothetical protein [Verrucomicrobiales bacterium]
MAKMITSIEQLLTAQISWNEEVRGGVEFFAYLEGGLCQLTMNNFPEKSLYTLRWHDSVLNVDDVPVRWTFVH